MMEHFQFAQPEWLYVLPFILCLLILRRRRGAEGSITYPTVRFIAPLARTPHSLAGKIGAVCFVLAAAAIAIALARPQKVEDKSFRTVNGIDIMIAFDLSYSMDTPDMVLNRMPINRLVAAKHVITQFVDSRPDDRIGIVGFAGKTKSFCPLTLDHALVNEIIHNFHLRMIQADGTAIGSAIAAGAPRPDSFWARRPHAWTTGRTPNPKSSSWSRTAPPTPVRYPRWWRRKTRPSWASKSIPLP